MDARSRPSSSSAARGRLARRRWAAPLALGCALALVLTALSTDATAQPRPRGQAATAIRSKVRAKILALRAYRVTEELGLDEATAARVFPLLSKYDQRVEQLTVERVAVNKALRNPPADPRAIDELIRRALDNRRAMIDLEAKRIGELRGVLTPAQTARLLVLLPEIERQLKAQIRAQRQRKRRGGDLINPFPPRGADTRPSAPDPDDEDDE
ncbi:MAG: hypothetical protein R3B48_23180 [Kofleriaceae bacterium]